MKINWKLKSIIFRTIDIFKLNQVLYYVQKNIYNNSNYLKLTKTTILKDDFFKQPDEIRVASLMSWEWLSEEHKVNRLIEKSGRFTEEICESKKT